LNNNNPTEAIRFYIEAFRAIHVVCIGRYRAVWADTWFNKTLQGGPYDRQHGQFVRIDLRVRLVANIVKAYLDMEDYEEAYFWGDRTLETIRQVTGNEDDIPMLNFPAPAVVGKIYFRTGMACKYLDRTNEARKLFQAAHGYLPRDERVKKEMRSVSFLIG
jgi:hypothetical protein